MGGGSSWLSASLGLWASLGPRRERKKAAAEEEEEGDDDESIDVEYQF